MADNINLSPDMIENLFNMLKNGNNTSETNDTSNFNEDSGESNSSSDSSNTIDFETIMKIKKIIDSMNNDSDPDSKLLYSLKPYLRKSRQSKLDQYINLLKVSKMTNFFKN